MERQFVGIVYMYFSLFLYVPSLGWSPYSSASTASKGCLLGSTSLISQSALQNWQYRMLINFCSVHCSNQRPRKSFTATVCKRNIRDKWWIFRPVFVMFSLWARRNGHLRAAALPAAELFLGLWFKRSHLLYSSKIISSIINILYILLTNNKNYNKKNIISVVRQI